MSKWLYPYRNCIISGRKVGKRDVRCPECNKTFSNELPWNAKYCPLCGEFNGDRSEDK